MKTTCVLFLFLAATLSLGQSSAAARRSVERQIVKFVAAMERKDLQGVQALMATDFKSSDQRGQTVDRVQAMRQLGNIFAHAKKVANSCRIRTFKLDGVNARLTASNVLDIEVPNGSGKVDRFHIESTTDEVWVPAGGAYKIKRSKVLSEKTLLNGRTTG